MILLTGAAGKTGRTVLKALAERDQKVIVLVRNNKQAGDLLALGAVDVIVGDMEDARVYEKALRGVKSLYHICPNMHPRELSIGGTIIQAAINHKLDHFVYHSVLHPQTEKMPHHWNKMRVEEMIFESGLEFTILQPAPYMQNILAGSEAISKELIYRVPYPVTTRLSMVDLQDLARAAATVLIEPDHKGATYEIVGTGGLSQVAVAEQLSLALGHNITAVEQPLNEWRGTAESSGMAVHQVEALIKMFNYYARYGLEGNSNVLSWLINGKPNSFYNFAKRDLAEEI